MGSEPWGIGLVVSTRLVGLTEIVPVLLLATWV